MALHISASGTHALHIGRAAQPATSRRISLGTPHRRALRPPPAPVEYTPSCVSFTLWAAACGDSSSFARANRRQRHRPLPLTSGTRAQGQLRAHSAPCRLDTSLPAPRSGAALPSAVIRGRSGRPPEVITSASAVCVAPMTPPSMRQHRPSHAANPCPAHPRPHATPSVPGGGGGASSAGDDDGAASTSTSASASIRLPEARRRLRVEFTCNKCGARPAAAAALGGLSLLVAA